MTINEPIKKIITVAATTGSNTYTFDENAKRTRRIVQLSIKPTSADTTYSIKFVDKFGITVFEEWDVVGSYSNLDPQGLPQFVYGNFTFTIYDSSNNEDFDVLMVFTEEV